MPPAMKSRSLPLQSSIAKWVPNGPRMPTVLPGREFVELRGHAAYVADHHLKAPFFGRRRGDRDRRFADAGDGEFDKLAGHVAKVLVVKFEFEKRSFPSWAFRDERGRFRQVEGIVVLPAAFAHGMPPFLPCPRSISTANAMSAVQACLHRPQPTHPVMPKRSFRNTFFRKSRWRNRSAGVLRKLWPPPRSQNFPTCSRPTCGTRSLFRVRDRHCRGRQSRCR